MGIPLTPALSVVEEEIAELESSITTMNIDEDDSSSDDQEEYLVWYVRPACCRCVSQSSKCLTVALLSFCSPTPQRPRAD